MNIIFWKWSNYEPYTIERSKVTKHTTYPVNDNTSIFTKKYLLHEKDNYKLSSRQTIQKNINPFLQELDQNYADHITHQDQFLRPQNSNQT